MSVSCLELTMSIGLEVPTSIGLEITMSIGLEVTTSIGYLTRYSTHHAHITPPVSASSGDGRKIFPAESDSGAAVVGSDLACRKPPRTGSNVTLRSARPPFFRYSYLPLNDLDHA